LSLNVFNFFATYLTRFYSQPIDEINYNQMKFDTSAQDMINSLVMGFDYSSLLNTLSSKYCMCEVFERYFNNQPSNSSFQDLTNMLGHEQSTIDKVRNKLSTLQIPPKGSHNGSVNQISPSTAPGDSPFLNPEIGFTHNLRDPSTQYQMTCGNAFANL
jgi:hypothetical protein